MSLPDSIEIVPPSLSALTWPLRIKVPGSKSITNRALILAGLSRGKTVLEGALWSEDTQVMVDCLKTLGISIEVAEDPEESCNRTITVHGNGGILRAGGSPEQPLELFVGNAGTAARFLTALLCLGKGVYRLSGVPRMHQRPQASLFKALRQLGYRLEAEQGNDRLPVRVYATGPREASCSVAMDDSSQFASALLLCERVGKWQVEVLGVNEEDSPYVTMTRELRDRFPKNGGKFSIEPDASSASYFWAAAYLLGGNAEESILEIPAWPDTGWQVDAKFPRYLPLPDTVSRASDLADSILTAMLMAVFKPGPTRFTDLTRLRLQECDRVMAMHAELKKCGANVTVDPEGDWLVVYPSAERLHGAEIETYKDHRIAMCFALLGLRVPGIKILDPSCVKKTFPNYFQKLASSPPGGFGARILGPDAVPLSGESLFAE
jgi:3-phosphoshikimate 1-carboxyvinyltransferase